MLPPKSTFTVMLFVVTFAAMTGGFFACTANQSDRSQMDRAAKMMNDGQYAQAKAIYQSELAKNPGNSPLMVQIAEADLGLAGIQIIDFISQVQGAQSPDTSADLVSMPQCDPGKIMKLQGADIRCILLRVAEHLPDPDSANFAEARSLLRQAYPDASTAPVDVNFLSAFVELGSALSRTKILMEKQTWTQANAGKQTDANNFHIVVHGLKNELDELFNGLNRTRYSYGKISKYVVNMDGKPLIRVGDQTLVFNQQLDTMSFLKFGLRVINEYRGSIDSELNKSLSDLFTRIPLASLSVMQRLDEVYATGFFIDNILYSSLDFEQGINRFLSLFLDVSANDQNINLLQMAWDHPPGLLKDFPPAFSSAWNQEDITPLLQYYKVTQTQWAQLQSIVSDWASWTKDNLHADNELLISAYLRKVHRTDTRLGLPPAQLTIDNLKAWQTQFLAASKEHLSEVLTSGSAAGLPDYTAEQQAAGQAILDRTFAWADANLWVTN